MCPIQFGSDSILTAKCGTCDLLVLLDTGSEINLICSETLLQIPDDLLQPVLVRRPIRVVSASGAVAELDKAYELPLQLGAQTCKVVLYEIKSLSRQVILGQPFLRRFKAVLDYESHTLRLGDLSVEPVETIQSLAPKECRLAVIRLISSHRNMAHLSGLVGVVYAAGIEAKVRVTPSLATVHEGLVSVMLVNCSKEIALSLIHISEPTRPY